MISLKIPLDPPIDLELSEWLADFIEKNYKYQLCEKHPEADNEIAIKVSNGVNYAQPLRFCCPQYQQYVMQRLEQFLSDPLRSILAARNP